MSARRPHLLEHAPGIESETNGENPMSMHLNQRDTVYPARYVPVVEQLRTSLRFTSSAPDFSSR
jgi:hypothetical protein